MGGSVPLAFASLLTIVDVAAFAAVKEIILKGWNPYFIVAPMVLYCIQPLILWKSLEYSSLTLMNVLWNVVSSTVVAILGLVIFQETLSTRELVGCVLGLLSIYVFSFNNVNDPFLSLLANGVHK